MTLRSLRRELERLEEIARSRPIGCVCRLVHVELGQPLTEEQQATLDNNDRCPAHNHAGFTVVEVVPISSGDEAA